MPIIHSAKAGERRGAVLPGSAGGGAGTPSVRSHRSIAAAYRPHRASPAASFRSGSCAVASSWLGAFRPMARRIAMCCTPVRPGTFAVGAGSSETASGRFASPAVLGRPSLVRPIACPLPFQSDAVGVGSSIAIPPSSGSPFRSPLRDVWPPFPSAVLGVGSSAPPGAGGSRATAEGSIRSPAEPCWFGLPLVPSVALGVGSSVPLPVVPVVPVVVA